MNATRTRKTKSPQSRGAAAKKKKSRTPSRGASAPRRSPPSTAKRGSSSRGSSTPVGQAIEMLMADHKMAQRMFRQAERAKDDPAQLREIVEAACAALTLHTEIEEQHLYPVMRDAIDDTEMISEAYIEHASAKQLIAELQGGDPEDGEYAARFKVLGEYVKHHIKEEENEIFPKARRARADFAPLLEALVARDEAVLAEGAEEETTATANGNGGRSRQSAGTAGRSAPRGRQGRGRGSASEAGVAREEESTARAGRSEGETDIEQPARRGRGSRTQEDTGDLESGGQGRESESEDAETRGSTQRGR